MLKPFITIFRRELKWMNKNKEYWFLSVFGPLVGFLLVFGIFYKGVVRDLDIAVIDNDNTAMSRKILRMIDATPIARISYHCNNLVEAEELLLKGKVNAIINVNKDLEKYLLKKSDKAKVVIYLNNANILKGSLLKSGILKTVATFNAGVQIQLAMKQGANYKQALVATVPIVNGAHALFNPYTNYFYFLAAVLMPVILIVFTLVGSIYSLGNELKNGTAEKALKKANNSILVLFTGKMLPYTFLFMGHMILYNYVIFHLMGLPINGNYFIILLSEFLLIVSYQALSALFMGVLGSLRLAVSLASAYSMMAVTFSGLTFPEIAMPTGAVLFGRIFPLTYWLDIFLGQTMRNDPLAINLPQVWYFFVFILAGLVSLYWLKQRYSNEKFWYKL